MEKANRRHQVSEQKGDIGNPERWYESDANELEMTAEEICERIRELGKRSILARLSLEVRATDEYWRQTEEERGRIKLRLEHLLDALGFNFERRVQELEIDIFVRAERL